MGKLTPEGAALQLEFERHCAPIEHVDWDTLAVAAIEASDEVKRLRAMEHCLRDANTWAMTGNIDKYHSCIIEACNRAKP